MKALGIIAIDAGILVAGHAMLSDVTVAVPSYGNYGTSDARVSNLGLMADRQNGLIIGGVLSITGLILVVASRPPNNDIPATPPNPKIYAAHAVTRVPAHSARKPRRARVSANTASASLTPAALVLLPPLPRQQYRLRPIRNESLC